MPAHASLAEGVGYYSVESGQMRRTGCLSHHGMHGIIFRDTKYVRSTYFVMPGFEVIDLVDNMAQCGAGDSVKPCDRVRYASGRILILCRS